MITNTSTPKALFQKDIRYVVPMFQRRYIWNQEEQWEPLWDDVRNTAERYLDNLDRLGPQHRADAEQETPPHFLGAVVLQQQPTPTTDLEERHVIDGQQRLTTLQLLLDAAQAVYFEQGISPGAARLAKLVKNDEDLAGTDSDHVFKIWPTTGDQEAFRHAMYDGLPTDNYADSNIVQAHEFFQLQIREWLVANADRKEPFAAALETTLSGLLQMVVIDLGASDDAHIIFETLNARGTPLRDSDLIKNFILYRAQADGINPDRLYREHWKTIEEAAWWRQDVRQGRLVRPRVDVFLNYWLSMRTAEEVPATRFFNMFRRYSEPLAINEVAADIGRTGQTFQALDSTSDPYEKEFIYRWRTMDAGVITPVLMLLFSAIKHELPLVRRRRALEWLESYLVRRMVGRLTTQGYNGLTLDLVAALQKEGLSEADDVVFRFLHSQTAESRLWPTDEQLTGSFLGLPLYRLLTRGRLRMVLEGIEKELRTPMTEQREVPRNLTIEHIMPQGWSTYWKLHPDVGDEEAATAERNRLIHSLGNLTLVNQKLNPHLSNGPWASKRQALEKHSVLYLNKDLLEGSTESTWDEDSIHQRSQRLAKLAASVWPREQPSTQA